MRNLKFLAVINFYIYVNMYLGLIKDMWQPFKRLFFI